MTLLDRHLLLALLRGGSPIFLLFLGLFGFMALAAQLEDVGKGTFGTLEALRVTGFSLPRIALDFLPVTCLLGTVLGLGTLGSQSELTAMRAAGIDILRLSRPLLLLLLAIVSVALLAQQTIIPAFESRAAYLRAHSLSNTTREGEAYWTRSQSSLMRVGDVEYGAMPKDIEIYRLDQDGRVSELVQAHSADLIGPGEWLLHEVRITRFGADSVDQVSRPQMHWRSDIDPEQIIALVRADHALAPADLIGYIRHLDRNGLDAHRYRLILWQQFGLSVGLVAMGLLGIPFVFGASRATPMGAQAALCAMIGLLFYLAEQASLQVGLLYRWPAPLAGLAPDVLMLAAAALIILWKR